MLKKKKHDDDIAEYDSNIEKLELFAILSLKVSQSTAAWKNYF